jgi:putative ABC transport system permease protein
LLLALDNAFRKRRRLVLTLLALVAGGAVFLGAQNLERAVVGSVDELFQAQQFDFSLRFSPPQELDRIEALAREVEGVAGAEALGGVSAALAHPDGTLGDSFTVVGLPADSKLMQPKLVEGRWLAPGDGDAFVASRGLLRDEPGLRPGTKVELEIDHVRSAWTVTGIVDSGVQPVAYAARGAVAARNGARSGTLAVRAASAGEATQLDLIRRLRDRFEEAACRCPAASGSRRTGAWWRITCCWWSSSSAPRAG